MSVNNGDTKRKRIVLCGGGTAGHIMPNIALLPYLSDLDIHYIGQASSMEEEVTRSYPQITFHTIKAVKLVRGSFFRNLGIPFRLMAAKRQAKRLLDEINPSVIFSKGGFVALPVVLSSKNIPVVLHESDYSLGLANKMSLKHATHCLTAFSSTANGLKKAQCVGAALRSGIYSGNKQEIAAKFTPSGRKNLLIMGGSLGARAINEAVFASIEELTKHFNVVHITGRNEPKTIEHEGYLSLAFTNSIADYFAWADVCVTRGGANALFELVALNKPSLVVPLPKGASRGDQILNTSYFEKMGCVRVLEQQCLTSKTLVEGILDVEKNRESLKQAMQGAQNIDGTKKIADIIRSFLV